MDENAGLSRAGAGEHQHRTIHMVGGFFLLRVELRIRNAHVAYKCALSLCERKANFASEEIAGRKVEIEKFRLLNTPGK